MTIQAARVEGSSEAVISMLILDRSGEQQPAGGIRQAKGREVEKYMAAGSHSRFARKWVHRNTSHRREKILASDKSRAADSCKILSGRRIGQH